MDGNAGQDGDDTRKSLTCPHCRSKIDQMKMTDHVSFRRVYCQGEEGVEPLDDEEDEDETSDSDSDSDPEDDVDGDEDNGDDLKDFIVPDDEPIDTDSDDDCSEDKTYRPGQTPFEKSKKQQTKAEIPSKKSGKGKGRARKSEHKSLAQLRKEGLRSKAAKKKYLKRLRKDFETSTKIEKTIELLENIHARGEGEKTIIFSGFTSFLDLLEVRIHELRHLGTYERYDGSMNAKERQAAVEKFNEHPQCTILLISLKAGNSGLNLNKASQVIILDPHWNGYVEAQAVDRAHRIGQTRPVEVHRVLISGEGLHVSEDGDATIEDRILKLQEKKRELVESALDENAARNVSRLGVRELGYLFVSLVVLGVLASPSC